MLHIKKYGSVAKIMFQHFETIILAFVYHFLPNEND